MKQSVQAGGISYSIKPLRKGNFRHPDKVEEELEDVVAEETVQEEAVEEEKHHQPAIFGPVAMGPEEPVQPYPPLLMPPRKKKISEAMYLTHTVALTAGVMLACGLSRCDYFTELVPIAHASRNETERERLNEYVAAYEEARTVVKQLRTERENLAKRVKRLEADQESNIWYKQSKAYASEMKLYRKAFHELRTCYENLGVEHDTCHQKIQAHRRRAR